MRISPVASVNLSQRRSLSPQKHHHMDSTAFKGWKGAGVGAGVGAVWAGVILTMTAVGAPYLLPLIATDAVLGGVGAGAFAGHCMENELKDNDKKK